MAGSHHNRTAWRRAGRKGRAAAVRNFLLLFALPAIVWSAVGGVLSGTVTDANGAAVAGVQVVAMSTSQGLKTKVRTDAKGAYRFPALSVGEYEVRVEAGGYRPSVRKIIIHVDDKARLDITLEPGTP